MPLPLVANTCHVTLRSMVDNQVMINNLYFSNEIEGITPLGLANLVTELATWFSTAVLPQLAEDVVFGVVRATDLSIGGGGEYEVTSGPTNGGVASEAAPNNVCVVPSFRTGIVGRSYRGRNYLSGVPNSQINTNVLDSGFALDIIGAYGMLIAGGPILPSNWDWVVVSYYTAGELRPTGVTNRVLQVVMSDTIVDSQRRRLPGRGK